MTDTDTDTSAAPTASPVATTVSTTRSGETIHLGGGAGTRHDRETTGFTVWFTGLSGSGKSTITHLLEAALRERGHKVEVLDGDVVRTHLSKGLGFSKEDRDTNILRIGWVCEVLSRNDVVAIAAAISPYRDIRDQVRANVGRFVEVYVEAPLKVLADRDVKGLYRKAMAGEIKGFTGVDDPYEAPLNPEVVCYSDGRETPEESAAKVLAKLEELGYTAPVESR
jgi:adenylylsulfate kinase